jgi:hypothetical protein
MNSKRRTRSIMIMLAIMSSHSAHSLLSIKQFGFERSYSGRHLTEASDEVTIANPAGPKKNDKLTFTARFGTDSKSVAAAPPEVILRWVPPCPP